MKKKRKFFLWIFLLVILTTYNSTHNNQFINNFFEVKEIEVFGAKNFDKGIIENKIKIYKGKNILFINNSDFKKIVEELKFVKNFKLKKVYPNRIRITIVELEPLAIYANKDGKKILILLEQGKSIFYYENNFLELPVVYGKNADKNFFNFYKSIKKVGFNVKLIKEFEYFDISRWDIILKDETLIKLPTIDYQNSLKQFSNLYKKDNFKKFKLFDFRIKQQLVVK